MSASTRHFVRHYFEMLAAMFLGMVVLGLPAGAALNALGMSSKDAPALIVMAVTMTVPMVGWMRYRGHNSRANTEMAAAMFLPTLGVIALLAGGLVEEIGALLVIEHVAMFAAMLGAMLLRRDEYSHGVHTHRGVQEATA